MGEGYKKPSISFECQGWRINRYIDNSFNFVLVFQLFLLLYHQTPSSWEKRVFVSW